MEEIKLVKSPSKPVWLFRSKDQTGTSQTRNLSFSFRLHNEDNDSDSSEGNKLTIDINEDSIKSGLSRAEEPQSESVASTPDSKGLFSPNSKIPNVLDQVEGEIERQLDLKAEKSKLTVINIKKIIRDVIMNKDVISMVRQSMDDKKIEVPYEPKLTRAKARELMEKQALSVVWPLHEVPSKQTPCKSKILMEKEYPEDSSDEEYRPSEDEPSDDDDINKSTTTSVLEDLNHPDKDDEIFDNEELGLEDTICEDESQPKRKRITFDLPPETPTDEEPHSPSFIDDLVRESIGQRTRSKLCLSETPLEEIEQAFIPPDITCDMYDFNCDNDDWTNFLKEFTQPLDTLPDMNETVDDVEADPEYNVLADEDTLTEDMEELRHDRGVKVSRREVKELIKELFEYTEMMSSEDKDKKKTQKSPVQLRESIGQRTRSKLCLSETPLEEIEQAFIPPDITCDMYDFNCDNDDWTNFLKEFTQPLDTLPDMNETVDDVEADPEYNVLADEDTLTEDMEELRHDRGVKVSRREVKELIKELFEYTEMMSSEDKDKKKTQKSPVQLV
ncbi:GON-4-like protein [Nilaparvata lugens]|uniref:GON-4-like protein n=1 Tax=Nilaparvata lugens TaxID=108931 RepID=UPI00193D29F1|nr:GON-4-like protein [Nilaparvata lugens]